MTVGTEVIPYIRRDNTDRNRTSPFAFTGNKFEFRMLGSGASISDANVMLNTMVADVFAEFADRLEGAADFNAEVHAVIAETIKAHGRIIFNGDGYSDEWRKQAAERGLLNLRSTIDAIPYLRQSENVALFERHGVLDRVELNCRADIAFENYCKTIHIEALTLTDMIRRDVIPATGRYIDALCRAAADRKAIMENADLTVETELIEQLSELNTQMFRLTARLCDAVKKAETNAPADRRAERYHDDVLWLMENIRHAADTAETLVPRDLWPYPGYDKLLFNI